MKNYKYLIMILLLLLNVAVEATVVSLDTGKQPQTQDGQVFNFNFMQDEVLLSDGTGGILFFQVRGDYSHPFPQFENLKIEIDGEAFGPYGPSTTGAFILEEFNDEDTEWGLSTLVTASLIDTWTSDGVIDMVVTLSSAVEINLAAQLPKQGYLFEPYIDVTLTYSAVPLPLSIWFFATGIFSLYGMRRLTAKST